MQPRAHSAARQKLPVSKSEPPCVYVPHSVYRCSGIASHPGEEITLSRLFVARLCMLFKTKPCNTYGEVELPRLPAYH